MIINSAFDSGNIIVTSLAGDSANLEIRKDAHSDFYQWFYFRGFGREGPHGNAEHHQLRWQRLSGRVGRITRARYSVDRHDWRQEAETSYKGGTLTIRHSCEADIVWFAYFAPYTVEQHHDLITRIAAAPGVTHVELGQSIEGQAIDYLQMGTGPVAGLALRAPASRRKHGEHWMEGALEMLTGRSRPDGQGAA